MKVWIGGNQNILVIVHIGGGDERLRVGQFGGGVREELWRAGVLVLGLSGDVVHVVRPELGGLDLLPPGGKTFLLERVGPMGSSRVVIYEISSSTTSPAYRPAWGESRGVLRRSWRN